ncbi:MAG: hypothetical protein ACFFCS_01240 [Candidatus Hodarchaeota archaeon]
MEERNVVRDRIGIVVTSIVLLLFFLSGGYILIDGFENFLEFLTLDEYTSVETMEFLKDYEEYLGGAILIGGFLLSPLLLRYAFKMPAFRMRNIFFSQISVIICLVILLGVALLSEINYYIIYLPWVPILLLSGGAACYLLAFFLRKRPRYVIGGFLIGIASIVVFYGMLGLIFMKVPFV